MRAPWLEPHDLFEGVGAHELNFRYDAVDGPDDDHWVRPVALYRAQEFLRTITVRPRLDGADTSHHQPDAGPFDPRMARAAGLWWWMHKATQSTRFVDPTFTATRSAMHEARFDYQLYFHWLSSTTDPEEQAAHFLRTVGKLWPKQGGSLDAEEAGITVAKCLGFAEAVEKVTKRPLEVYTGAYVAGGTIWRSESLCEGKYGPRPKRLAAYTTDAKALALPGVRAFPWDAWQWSSNGPVPGVTGRCDMNRVDDRAAYDLACGINVAPAPVPPPPAPPVEHGPVLPHPSHTTPANPLGDDDMSNTARLYRDRRFKNVFLIGAPGGPFTVSGETFASYAEAGVPQIVDEHDPMLEGLLIACGMTRADLIAANG